MKYHAFSPSHIYFISFLGDDKKIPLESIRLLRGNRILLYAFAERYS